jgi:Cytidylate kinase-like family
MDSSLAKLVERSCRHWEGRRRVEAGRPDHGVEPPLAMTIALEREVGTQGTRIANETAKLLGWQVYDHELLEHIAKEMGLRAALLESIDERLQGWLRDSIESFLASFISGDKTPWATESSYVHHLVETVVALGVHGECVIVGRGAAFLLPARTTMRVRLVGTERDRIKTLARVLNLSERDAMRQVHEVDRRRCDFVRNHFNKNPEDPSNYDVVLNAIRLSTSGCAEVIVEALKRFQAHDATGDRVVA